MAALVKPGGTIYTLLPLGVRVGEGYHDMPELLDCVLAWLPALGLEVAQQIAVRELRPVSQPFVGKNRPNKVTLVLRTRGGVS
ncbi:MAG: hypothetical protein MUF54_21495 [Polyangiaceae bacterium]|nr:hypothetical protein [Polyangiaceae bacterium]